MYKLNFIIYYFVVVEKIQGKKGDFWPIWWGFGVCAQTCGEALYNKCSL